MSAAPAAATNNTNDDAPSHLSVVSCCVCLEPPSGRVEQCPSGGHILCAEEGDGSCLAKIRKHALVQRTTPRCSSCRCLLPAELQRCLVAEQTIALLPAQCRHCGEGLTRGQLTSHEASCPRGPNVRCAASAEGCAWEGRGSERAAHEQGCALRRLCARFEGERRVFADFVVQVAGEDMDLEDALFLAGPYTSPTLSQLNLSAVITVKL